MLDEILSAYALLLMRFIWTVQDPLVQQSSLLSGLLLHKVLARLTNLLLLLGLGVANGKGDVDNERCRQNCSS